MRPFARTLVAGSLALGAPALAHAAEPKLDKDLPTAQRIVETVQASIGAANALMKVPHEGMHANTFFALLQRDTWFVYFGWLEPDGSKFTSAQVMSAPRSAPATMHPIDAKAAPAEVLPYARAVTASRVAAAKATGNPHVDPVLLPGKGGIEVYVLQGGGKPGVILLGGDFLDRYDATGAHLMSRVQFHKGIIPVPQSDPSKPGAKAVGSYHTHVIDEGPTVTDLAAVLLHPTLAPMLVMGRSGKGYRVDEQGHVHLEPDMNLVLGAKPGGAAGADVPKAEK